MFVRDRDGKKPAKMMFERDENGNLKAEEWKFEAKKMEEEEEEEEEKDEIDPRAYDGVRCFWLDQKGEPEIFNWYVLVTELDRFCVPDDSPTSKEEEGYVMKFIPRDSFSEAEIAKRKRQRSLDEDYARFFSFPSGAKSEVLKFQAF